ncbi:MAG: hypothetical protein WD336_09025 [Trueperaceae bacterium]
MTTPRPAHARPAAPSARRVAALGDGPPRSRIGPLRTVVLALVLLACAPLASSQSLPALLPDDVALAVGVVGLEAQADRWRPFLDEAERLDLLERLAAAIPAGLADDAGLDGDADAIDLPDGILALDAMDLLGREAWLTVSASRFRPLPAVTIVTRTTPAAEAAFADWIADAADGPGTVRRNEGDAVFYTRLPGPDATGADLGVPVAYAQQGDLLVLSSDPEIVRSILRARAGGSDPVWADSDTYRAMADLGDGHLFGLIDAAPLTSGLNALAGAYGAGPLLARVQDALRSAGPSAGLLRFEDGGLASRTVQLPRADGPDPQLVRLLTGTRAADPTAVSFAPDGALAVASSGHDLTGWWAWLDDVLAAGTSLGLPDASEAAQLFGLDVKGSLLAWTGDRSVQIVTGPPAAAQPGIADAPLLGEQALLIATDAPDAARAGLERTFTDLGAMLGGFLAPSGMGAARPTSVQVAGVEVLRLELSETLALDAAVLDGWVLLTGSPEATEAVLAAHASGGTGPEALASAALDLPSDAVRWSLTNDRASLAGGSEAAVAQLQLIAGLAGAGALDFAAVDDASDALSVWLAFVAERLGTSASYVVVEEGRLQGRGFTDVAW